MNQKEGKKRKYEEYGDGNGNASCIVFIAVLIRRAPLTEY
jgi:hypothetical protein